MPSCLFHEVAKTIEARQAIADRLSKDCKQITNATLAKIEANPKNSKITPDEIRRRAMLKILKKIQEADEAIFSLKVFRTRSTKSSSTR